MSAPWGNPPPPDRRGYHDFIGRPVITIVGGVRRDVPSQWGVRDLPHVSIVSLVGPDAGFVYSDIIVFTTRIAGRLKASEPGAVILSKVVDKGKAPDIDDPDQWDQQAATSWFNANPGLLDQLRQGAINDFHAFLAKPQQGQPAQQQGYGAQTYGAQPAQPAPQQHYVAPTYAQPAPQQQYAPPQQQYVAPGPQHQAQLREVTPNGGNDAPPAQPPPQNYVAPNATLESMRSTVPPAVDSTPPPF
jgi:hypothetical protein